MTNSNKAENGYLGLTLNENDEVQIGEEIFLRCSSIGSKRLRIVVSAPKSVRITRSSYFKTPQNRYIAGRKNETKS